MALNAIQLNIDPAYIIGSRDQCSQHSLDRTHGNLIFLTLLSVKTLTVKTVETEKENLKQKSHIEASDIEASDIEASDIEASDIEASDIEASDIEAFDIETLKPDQISYLLMYIIPTYVYHTHLCIFRYQLTVSKVRRFKQKLIFFF